jgi:hypothetical protein
VTFDSDLIAAVQTDHQYVVGLETVTYTVKATGAATTTVKGVPVASDMDEPDAVAVSKATRQAWLLWSDTMGTITPSPGDTITDTAGVKWTVDKYDGQSIGAAQVYFQCECVKQR